MARKDKFQIEVERREHYHFHHLQIQLGNVLTIKKKLEIIDRVDNLPLGKRKKDIASEFGIPQSTILKDKAKLRASYTVGSTKKKRHRDPTRSEVDAALFQWFTATRAQSIPISGELLKANAEDFSKEVNPTAEWTCSSG